MVASIAQAAESVLIDSPITTGAIFVALTGAIAYLYRARDRDRETEVTRLERQIERLEEVIDLLRRELGDR
jgi:hypothetical protein